MFLSWGYMFLQVTLALAMQREGERGGWAWNRSVLMFPVFITGGISQGCSLLSSTMKTIPNALHWTPPLSSCVARNHPNLNGGALKISFCLFRSILSDQSPMIHYLIWKDIVCVTKLTWQKLLWGQCQLILLFCRVCTVYHVKHSISFKWHTCV